MKYERIVWLSPCEAKKIRKYMAEEPSSEDDCFGLDETISHTAQFDNGVEVDIKCCGVQYQKGESNRAWAEAVLFNNGCEVECTEPCDEYLGTWNFTFDGDEYVVYVKEYNTTQLKVSIKFQAGLNVPDFKMEIDVPTNRDTEEYIDEFLESIFNENLKFSAEWEFC